MLLSLQTVLSYSIVQHLIRASSIPVLRLDRSTWKVGVSLLTGVLQKYQKDAIYRQMLEYKREKATLESHLKEVQKRAVDHDDHIRVIDAWFSQVISPWHVLWPFADIW